MQQGIYIANVDNFKHKKWKVLQDEKKQDIPGTGTNNLALYEIYTNIDILVNKLSTKSEFYNSRIGIDSSRKIKYIIDFDKFDETTDPLINYLNDIIKYVSVIFDVNLTIDDFAISKNDDYKHNPLASYHVIIKSLIDTPANQKIFFDGLFKYNKKFNKSIIDTTIYSNHWFRLPNQNKGKTKDGFDKGKHQIINGSMIDFIPEYFEQHNVKSLSFDTNKFKQLFQKQSKKQKINIVQHTTSASDFGIVFSIDQLTELIPKLLNLLEPEYYDNYKLWIDILYIIKNELGDNGKEIARRFSQKSESYEDHIFEDKWNSLKNQCTKKIGSLFYNCYQNPKNRQILRELKSSGNFSFFVTDNWIAKELKLMISKYFVIQKIISKKQEIIKILYFTEEFGWQYDTSSDSALNNYLSDKFQDYIVKKYESNSTSWPKIWESITKALGSNSKKAQIIKEFKNICANDNNFIEFDNKPYLLKFKNGVLDLIEGNFREHRFTDYMIQNTKINWREPTIEELKTMNTFFDSIFKDEKMKYLLFKILASGLIGMFVEKFIIWWGDGGNGKGTINDLMAYLLGDYYGECNATYLTVEREIGNDEILASFRGKRYIKSSEPGKKFCASKIKSLTGETIITATAKYESGDSTYSTFVALYTMVCETNQCELKFKKTLDEKSNQKDINALKRRQISFPWITQFTDDSDDLDDPNFVIGNPIF